MRRRSLWLSLLAAPLLLVPLGCSKSNQKRPPPPDPLLMSKSPVSARYGRTDIPERPDPTPPAMPAGAWLNTPGASGSVQLGAPDAGHPSMPPPSPFRWTSEKKPGAVSQPETPHRMQQMQGVLEKTAGGSWLLAGKVLLEGHQRLDLLQPGDEIAVEGYVVEEHEVRSGAWLPHPRFHVEHLDLIHRKS